MTTNTKFTVRPAAEIPPAGSAVYRKALESIGVGQSLLFETAPGDFSRARNAMGVTIRRIAKRTGKKFATRNEGGNVVVWRVS